MRLCWSRHQRRFNALVKTMDRSFHPHWMMGGSFGSFALPSIDFVQTMAGQITIVRVPTSAMCVHLRPGNHGPSAVTSVTCSVANWSVSSAQILMQATLTRAQWSVLLQQ